MALKLPCTLDSDVSLPEAYMKIVRFEGRTPDNSVEVTLIIFKDEAARQANKAPASAIRVSVPCDLTASGNLFQNLYSAVKKLPEYAQATDV